jgi:hypothetical protein
MTSQVSASKKGNAKTKPKTKPKPKPSENDKRSWVRRRKKGWMVKYLIPLWIQAREVASRLRTKKSRDNYMEEFYRRSTTLWFATFGYGLPYNKDPVLREDESDDDEVAEVDEDEGSVNDATPDKGGHKWDPVPEPADWDETTRQNCFQEMKKVIQAIPRFLRLPSERALLLSVSQIGFVGTEAKRSTKPNLKKRTAPS